MKWAIEAKILEDLFVSFGSLQLSGDRLAPDIDRERRQWELHKDKLLLYAGLVGLFTYMLIVTLLGKPFYYEFCIAFVAMMGIGIIQGFGKKQ